MSSTKRKTYIHTYVFTLTSISSYMILPLIFIILASQIVLFFVKYSCTLLFHWLSLNVFYLVNYDHIFETFLCCSFIFRSNQLTFSDDPVECSVGISLRWIFIQWTKYSLTVDTSVLCNRRLAYILIGWHKLIKPSNPWYHSALYFARKWAVNFFSKWQPLLFFDSILFTTHMK